MVLQKKIPTWSRMLFIHTITPNNMEELQNRIEELELQIRELQNEIEKKDSKIQDMESEMNDIYTITKKY